MNTRDNIRYFDSDDEFYEYSIIPKLNIINYISNDGTERAYYDFNFTPQYLNDINNGVRFVIMDEDSSIYKHGAVSYRTITKEVQNLDPWFEM